MKKRVLLLAVVMTLLLTCSLSAARLGVLEDVLKPKMIKVLDDDLLVVEGHQVFIYSIKDFKLKKVIGKAGEGPGEFMPEATRSIVISILPEYILGESRHKVLYFDRKGNYIKEIRKIPTIIQTIPVGKNFVTLKILYGKGGENYFTVALHDPDLKEIKELYRQPFFNFKDRTYLMPDGLYFCVVDDKVFVDESPEGFVIDVFDSNGSKLYRIEKEYEKVPVTSEQKEAAFNEFLEIPAMRRMIQEKGRAAAVIEVNNSNPIYPEYFPAMQYISTDGKELYVKTHKVKDDKEEYIIMDLKGKILNTVFLPAAKKVDFLVGMQGDKKYFTFYNNKFYYLKYSESDEDEVWEVHVEDIK